MELRLAMNFQGNSGYTGYTNTLKSLITNKTIFYMSEKIDRQIKNLAKPNEKRIEKSLRDMVISKNGSCLKFISPGNNGVPDRLCLLPGGRVWFVETKYPGKEPDPLQLIVHAALEGLGFRVRIVSNLEQLKQFENEISAL